VWSLHWKSGRFKLSDWEKCLPHQRLNHCPKSSGITKKDNLHRNIKRLAGSYGKIFDFLPMTFVLPNEYLAFMQAFTERQESDEEGEKFWICKPSDSSRGRGIFIISHIAQLVYDQQYVVQEYISRPLTGSPLSLSRARGRSLSVYVCMHPPTHTHTHTHTGTYVHVICVYICTLRTHTHTHSHTHT